MHAASYEFLMKPKESAGCHHTLSTWVGSGDETRPSWVWVSKPWRSLWAACGCKPYWTPLPAGQCRLHQLWMRTDSVGRISLRITKEFRVHQQVQTHTHTMQWIQWQLCKCVAQKLHVQVLIQSDYQVYILTVYATCASQWIYHDYH